MNYYEGKYICPIIELKFDIKKSFMSSDSNANDIKVFTTGPLFEYLEEHNFLAEFIHIDSSSFKQEKLKKNQTYQDYCDSQNKETFNRMSMIQQKQQSWFAPVPFIEIRRPAYFTQQIQMIYSKILYVKKKARHIRSIQRSNFTLYMNSLIYIYTHELIPPLIIIHVDEKKLRKFLKRPFLQILSLHVCYENMCNLMNHLIDTKFSASQQQATIQKIIQSAQQMVDPQLHFYPPTPIQDEFEDLIMRPEFFANNLITNLINHGPTLGHAELYKEIIKIVEEIIGRTKARNKKDATILLPLVVRCIFDEMYPKLKIFFVPELQFDLIFQLRYLTLSDLQVPKKYSPPIKPDDIPAVIFRNDPYYFTAIEQLEFTPFFTNPLDILHHIYHSLNEIEKAAAYYYKGDPSENIMLAFDDTFSLFICTLVGSDLPEFMRIAAFTDSFAPTTGLCSYFEFALTKLKTASIHMQNMVQKMMTQHTLVSNKNDK